MLSQTHFLQRERERGVTILLVAVAMVVVLAMAALAIDVVTLYVARTEAQRAADAAALAGAKAFVSVGFTSSLPGFSSTDVCGTGSSGAVNQQAVAAAVQNLISGVPATVQAISCNVSQAENPQVTVTVQRTNLPTFFARIWGSSGNSVSATATAEAYNPSGSSPPVPVSVAFVKPFLIPNCDPSGSPPPCGGGYFVSTSNYTLNNPGNYIGRSLALRTAHASGAPQYYDIDLPEATVCPGTTAFPPASPCGSAGGGGFYDNIACANTNVLQCGDQVFVDRHSKDGSLVGDITGGVQCLIHASSTVGTTVTCDSPNTLDQDCFLPTPPFAINGGKSSPNPAFRPPAATSLNISRSDSVVTVPLYDGSVDPCALGGPCNDSTPLTVIGFLQLGIQDVRSNGTIDAMVLNAAGCDPDASGTPVAGGGVSPIPVRLIHN